MFSYDLEIYDGLKQQWFFMGNARTVLGAKIGWRDICLKGAYSAARVIEQPTGGVVWHSEPGDLDKVAHENRAAPMQDWSFTPTV